MADLTKALDGTQEAVDMLLAMLADKAPEHVSLLGSTMSAFKVSFYKQTACELAEAEPVIAALLATGRERMGVLTGKMQTLAHASGLPPDAVQHALQGLAARGQIHLQSTGDAAVALRLCGKLAQLPVTPRELHARLGRVQQSVVRQISPMMLSCASSHCLHTSPSKFDVHTSSVANAVLCSG